jgi:hypothetical protein
MPRTDTSIVERMKGLVVGSMCIVGSEHLNFWTPLIPEKGAKKPLP